MLYSERFPMQWADIWLIDCKLKLLAVCYDNCTMEMDYESLSPIKVTSTILQSDFQMSKSFLLPSIYKISSKFLFLFSVNEPKFPYVLHLTTAFLFIP